VRSHVGLDLAHALARQTEFVG
jgi:hypothetical protein